MPISEPSQGRPTNDVPHPKHHLVLGNLGTHAANQTLYRHPLYNAVADFAPVILVAETPLLLIARDLQTIAVRAELMKLLWPKEMNDLPLPLVVDPQSVMRQTAARVNLCLAAQIVGAIACANARVAWVSTVGMTSGRT